MKCWFAKGIEMNRAAGLFLLAIAVSLNSVVARAQQPGEAPRLILNTSGASQPVRALRFSPDGTRLYVAGDHKCVNVWRIPQQPQPPSLETSLHWEISRGNLGRIYAMDVAPNGKSLVIGGYSGRNKGGDLALFDLPGNQFNKPLPAADRTVANMATSGHVAVINGTSFSVDGKRLATIDEEGAIFVWSIPDGAVVDRLAQRAAQSVVDASRQLSILHLASGAVVAPVSAGGRKTALSLFESGKSAKTLLSDDARLVTLARDATGQQWASLHQQQPHTRIWDQDGQLVRSIQAPRQDTHPTGLALGPGNLVLVAEHQILPGDPNSNYFNQRAPAWLQLWDASQEPAVLIDELQISTSPTSVRCTFSPDGRWAAATAEDGEDVRLYALVDAQGARLAKPLTGRQSALLKGRGMPFWKVAFEEVASAKGDFRIGFGIDRQANITFNDYAAIAREFDLVAGKYSVQTNPQSRWRTPKSGAAEWNVTPSEGETVLQLTQNGNRVGQVRLDLETQGRCISWCFIPATRERPLSLAVGMWGETAGIFVYELSNPAQPRLVRYYRDHQHWVTSLSVSADGKYLASASRDQMIKVWSLDGLGDRPVAFSNAAAWGATFVVRGNQLILQDVRPAGIIASRGLQSGDVITAVNRVPVTNPQQVVKSLNSLPLWQTQGLNASGVRNGKAVQFADIAITPAWEPLLSLFVDRNHEWAVWTPRGFYDASAEGDKLFGWLVNRARGQAPLFLRSDQLRKDMERPDVIKSLLLAGNHDTALRAGGEPARVTETNPVRDIAVNKMPVIRITNPANKFHVPAGAAVSIEATGEFPAGLAVNSFQPQAFVNKAPLPPPVVQPGAAGQMKYIWNFQPTSPNNHVQVKLVGSGDRATAHYVEAQVNFTAEIEPPRRKMFFLGISAQEYPNEVYRSLLHTHADIDAIKTSLEIQQGVHYDLSADSIALIRDQEITADAITSQARMLTEKIAQRGAIGRDDLLVIAISGHGDRVESKTGAEYFFIAPHPGIKTFGDDPRSIERRGAEISQYAIPWRLLEGLGDVPCLRLFLLDTCHSGAVKESRTTQNAKRAMDRMEAFVMTSAAADERSWEGGKLKQGVFTHCLLEGLNGLADGADQSTGRDVRDEIVDLLELAEYVKQTAPKKAEDLSGIPQHPNFIPGSIDSIFRIPLVRIQNRKTSSVSP